MLSPLALFGSSSKATDEPSPPSNEDSEKAYPQAVRTDISRVGPQAVKTNISRVGNHPTYWRLMLQEPGPIEVGIQGQHELLRCHNPLGFVLRRLNPQEDKAWLKVRGEMVYRARRYQDPEWRMQLGFLREAVETFPRSAVVLKDFIRMMEEDARMFKERDGALGSVYDDTLGTSFMT